MKIKQKRQVNLPQLIEWVWEKDKNEFFKSVNEEEVKVYICRGSVGTEAGNENPSADALFEIEEEVEIDEDTILDKIIELYAYAGIRENLYMHKRSSISKIIKEPKENLKTTHIYYLHPDGTMTLIWKDGEMVK